MSLYSQPKYPYLQTFAPTLAAGLLDGALEGVPDAIRIKTA